MRYVRDVPALKTMQYSLDPVFYNHVRLALLRLGSPLQLQMETLRVVLELEHQRWTAFFMQESGLPLIQWKSFDHNRSGLDQPVECTLLLYHYQSWLMFPQILAEMDRQLYQRLHTQHLKRTHLKSV